MNPLKSNFEKMKAALVAGCWKEEKGRHGLQKWLGSIVGRRLLHRYIERTGQHHSLNAIPLTAQSRASILEELQTASKQIPSGTIVIEGNMAQVQISDWLAVEANAIKEILTNSPKVKINVADLLDALPEQSDSPAFIRSFAPSWSIFGDMQLAASLLAIFVCGTLLTLDPALRLLGMVAAGASLPLVLLISTLLYRNVQAAHGKPVFQAADDLSSTWDDVFAMRTDMDAVLLGMLFGIINEGRALGSNRVIPDFLAMAPAQAYLIATKLVNKYGYFNSNLADMLLTETEKLAVAPSMVNAGIIDGFDLSAFQQQANPEPEVISQQPVHVADDRG